MRRQSNTYHFLHEADEFDMAPFQLNDLFIDARHMVLIDVVQWLKRVSGMLQDKMDSGQLCGWHWVVATARTSGR